MQTLAQRCPSSLADRRNWRGSIWADRYVAIPIEVSQTTDQGLDVLVSNAGICPFAEFLTMPHATWERTRQVNLDGSFYVTQGAVIISPWQGSPYRIQRTLISQRLRTK